MSKTRILIIALMLTPFYLAFNSQPSKATSVTVTNTGQFGSLYNTATKLITQQIMKEVQQLLGWKQTPGQSQVSVNGMSTGILQSATGSNFVSSSGFNNIFGATASPQTFQSNKTSAMSSLGNGQSTFNYSNSQNLQSQVSNYLGVALPAPIPNGSQQAQIAQNFQSQSTGYAMMQAAAGIASADTITNKYKSIQPSSFDSQLSDAVIKDVAKMSLDNLMIQVQILRTVSGRTLAELAR